MLYGSYFLGLLLLKAFKFGLFYVVLLVQGRQGKECYTYRVVAVAIIVL